MGPEGLLPYLGARGWDINYSHGGVEDETDSHHQTLAAKTHSKAKADSGPRKAFLPLTLQ